MKLEWFYEYEGRECGPIPSETLLHLAQHGAISRESRVRKQGMAQSVAAERVKGLFPAVDATPSSKAHAPALSGGLVATYLRKALDHCRDDADGDLMKQSPPIGTIWPWGCVKFLLDYEICGIQQVPAPVVDMNLPLGARTKPVKAMYQASLKVTICERPAYRTTLAQLRLLQPGREEMEPVLTCKEFEDGSWIFMDSTLEG
jgi:hypothetical protein